MTTNLHDKMLAAIDALFSASDAVEEEVAENLLLDVRDDINKHKGKELLHKLAADSITEGLRLDDWPKIGCVNHDCDKCKAQQEPVAVVSGYYGGQCVVLPINRARLFNSGTAFYTTPQAQPAREPLTAKEIAEFVGTHEYGPEQLKWFRLGEAAHGITKGNT